MSQGDSCNAVRIGLSNHLGSHVDAPSHFVTSGRSVDEYAPKDWFFCRPLLVDVPMENAEVINQKRLEVVLPMNAFEIDIVLIRTGFGRYRGALLAFLTSLLSTRSSRFLARIQA